MYFYICIIILLLYYYIYDFPTKQIIQDTEQIAIVSTIKEPHNLETWIRYHLNVGFDHIYLIFDDPNDYKNIKIANKFINVSIFINNQKWKNLLSYLPNFKQFGKTYSTEVMSRQILNVDLIMILANKKNHKWLLHIDSDELFYTTENLHNLFNKYERYIVKFKNLELAPKKYNYKNCFKEGTLFKKNGYKFIAYYNGKSATQTHKNCRTNGVHDFKTIPKTKIINEKLENACILHYVSCNFDEYFKKYKILGNFSDKWWGTKKIGIKFHTQSRDKIMFCNDELCKNDILQFYKKNYIITDKDENENLIEIDINSILT
tara:strand:- start:953 stop:1906 length:954 start_codon:yes stop_codon:yes gene_type:complete